MLTHTPSVAASPFMKYARRFVIRELVDEDSRAWGEDDEQPWNAAQPLSGAEARVKACLAEARYVERTKSPR